MATGLEKSYSFQSKRKAISENVHLPHSCTHFTCYQSSFSRQVFSSTWTVKFHMFKLDLEKAEEPEIKFLSFTGSLKKQGNSRTPSAILTTLKTLTVWITTNCGKFLKRWEFQTTWPAYWEIYMQVKKQQLELNMEQQTASKFGKEYNKAVYCHPAYLNFMQSTSC